MVEAATWQTVSLVQEKDCRSMHAYRTHCMVACARNGILWRLKVDSLPTLASIAHACMHGILDLMECQLSEREWNLGMRSMHKQ